MIRKLTLATLLAISFVSPGFAADMDDIRSITVSGEGEEKAAPDKVDVQLGISEQARVLEDARRLTDSQLKALTAITKELGIAEKDLQTTYSSVQPNYRYEDATGKNIFDGYTVTHNVTVTIRNLDKLGDFIEKVLAAKIDEINNIAYGREEQDALKEAALKEAIEKARRKAEVMAATAGVKVGKVLTLYESSAVMPPMPMPMMRGGMAMASMAMDKAAVPPAGEIAVQTTVTVTYELTE